MLSLLLLLAVLAHNGSSLRHVSITVASPKLCVDENGLEAIQRDLEMNWQPGLEADWIGLFNITPRQQATPETTPLVRISPADYPDGYYNTTISFANQAYPNGWDKRSDEPPVAGDACLPYWIAAYKNNDLLHADCLKIRPTWMGDHRSELENKPLVGLFFPGMYDLDSEESVPSSKQTVGHFLLAQDNDVWGELVHGIRYFDLDIGYYLHQWESSTIPASTEEARYSVENDTIDEEYLLPLLNDIKKFLKKAEYEIVILDFHHFLEASEGQPVHRQFVSLLYSELGDFILPFNNITFNTTIGEVWSSGHNLVVAYNDAETTKEFAWLWGPIPQLWGDQQTTEGLKAFLQQCMDDASAINETTPQESMTATTPASIDSISKKSENFHELIDMASRNVTEWFQNYWWRHANLVATDFFLGNNNSDVTVRACLDKANNIIFQVASDDD